MVRCGRGPSFRLLTEPASLKLEAGGGVVDDAGEGFRLLTEPASLKRVAIHCGSADGLAFPAPHRAGLIEA